MLLTLGIRDVLAATPRARIVRIDLQGATFDYVPGQAVLVGNAGGPKRPYSLASAPAQARHNRCLELLVGVDAHGMPGSHLTLEPGRLVDIEGPVGSFTFPHAPAERRFLFIAGGTGIAPLRAMLYGALDAPHQQIGLFYSARTPDEFAFEAEWRALAREGRIEFRQTVTRSVEETWGGARGRIDRVQLESLLHDPGTLTFICGPQAFVTEISLLLVELGVPQPQIRVEKWG